jgi:hypothetical protein
MLQLCLVLNANKRNLIFLETMLFHKSQSKITAFIAKLRKSPCFNIQKRVKVKRLLL